MAGPYQPMIDIEAFATGLAGIPEAEFTHEGVLDYMRRHPVSPASLHPYLYFSAEHYTRNLIRHTPLFDLIAICWESGQRSAIHNHTNQRCWMGIAYGRVQVQNFRVVAQDAATGVCELAPTDHYIIEAGSPAEVNPEEPVHLVTNPSSFGSRAVTLHIYSLPFDECEIYHIKERRYEIVKLSNTSEYGVLQSSLTVEKVTL
jgi:cysteine dioxygenase